MKWWAQTVAWSAVGLLMWACSSFTYLSGGTKPQGISEHQFFHGDR